MSLTEELARELEGARKSYITECHVDEPTQTQTYRWLLNNFHCNMPFGLYWTNYRKVLDRPISEVAHFDPTLRSKLHLSKTFREFSLEVGEAARLSGVTINYVDFDKYTDPEEWHREWLKIDDKMENLTTEFYNAYAFLRARGYNYIDLTS